MILKFLGILDIISGIVLILSTYDFMYWRIAFLFSVYLILKGVVWRGSIPSFLDLCIGIYLLMSIFFASSFISWIAAGYLWLKALQSMF
jgi:hypothetical protein